MILLSKAILENFIDYAPQIMKRLSLFNKEKYHNIRNWWVCIYVLMFLCINQAKLFVKYAYQQERNQRNIKKSEKSIKSAQLYV